MSTPDLSQRPSVKEIISTITAAMHKGIEDLGGSYLVPSYFEVLLHPDTYTSLNNLEPYIKERARAKLEQELYLLNQRHFSKQLGGLKKWIHQTFQKRDITSPSQPSQAYKKTAVQWVIEMNPSYEADIPLNYIGVKAEMRGLEHPTAPIITPQLPVNAIQETPRTRRFTAKEPEVSPQAIREVQEPKSAAVVVIAEPLAQISYQDNTGYHVVQMQRPDIIIGRADTTNTDVDIRIHTNADVSRTHLRINYDLQTRSFKVREQSKFGTHLNGLPLPSNVWTSLGSYAELTLADTVTLIFQALK
jgi:hypothetical protein